METTTGSGGPFSRRSARPAPVYGMRWRGSGRPEGTVGERIEPDAEGLQEICDVTADWSYTLHIEPDGTTIGDWTSHDIHRVTGYTLAELGGVDPWIRLVHPEDRPAMRAHLEALQAGRTDVVEYRIRTRSGETRWIRDYARPLGHDPEGAVHVVGGVRDITARRQAEADRARLLSELELCDERLEGLLRSLEHEMDAAAHEVELAAEAMAGDAGTAGNGAAGPRARAAARRLRDLQGRLAALTALETIDESGAPIHLGPLAEEALGRRRDALRDSGSEVTVGRLPVVFGDGVRVQELVELLLDRCLVALGANPGGHVEIGCRSVEEGLATIFVKQEADPGGVRTLIGTAVGAAADSSEETAWRGRDAAEMLLAQRIVELHGGRLWVEAAPEGTGRIYLFQLPA